MLEGVNKDTQHVGHSGIGFLIVLIERNRTQA